MWSAAKRRRICSSADDPGDFLEPAALRREGVARTCLCAADDIVPFHRRVQPNEAESSPSFHRTNNSKGSSGTTGSSCSRSGRHDKGERMDRKLIALAALAVPFAMAAAQPAVSTAQEVSGARVT